MNKMPTTALDELDDMSRKYSQNQRQRRTSMGRKVSGRQHINDSATSLASQTSFTNPNGSQDAEPTIVPPRMVSQILDWLHEEKVKRARHANRGAIDYESSEKLAATSGISLENAHERLRAPSHMADDGMALDKLEQILAENLVLDHDMLQRPPRERPSSKNMRRLSSIQKLGRGSINTSSDTEYQDGDAVVPTTDVVLDNSKTMSYLAGGAESNAELESSCKAAKEKGKEDWHIFKREIVRLAHTLKLKGWRRVPLDRGGDIDVERLSGALTNAVYVVSPPNHLPNVLGDGTPTTSIQKPPPKLLLRIYGPQVAHLIDRESELQILRRLARKKIGPRLLGTFTNGRFEEFFHARTLTAQDLRMPETSKQIAKRMRELHDGIELLEEERDAGPFVWRNWDKWVARCEEVVTYVDHQILHDKAGPVESHGDEWKSRGLVCGVEWAKFRRTVEKFRHWLDSKYGGPASIRKELVFAHNDTQYGNLLRLKPSGESPLILPANEHKQLVVIDFEYASANVPGLEFANHFTEWCYNYHDPSGPHTLNSTMYPTPSEQNRFIKAYVTHRPQFHPRASSTTLSTMPATISTPSAASSDPSSQSTISTFALDSRAPPAQIEADETATEEVVNAEVERLLAETRLWRVANSAQWVAWGIVQAKVEGMGEALATAARSQDAKQQARSGATGDDDGDGDENATNKIERGKSKSRNIPMMSDPLSHEAERLAEAARDKRRDGEDQDKGNPEEAKDEDEHEEEAEFDYLGYAQQRALFFWGDVLRLGIVNAEDLPEEVLEKVKRVDY